MNPLRLLPGITAAVLLCAAPTAQTPLDFTIDNAASQYTWSGTTSVGPLLGNPSNQFGLSGNFRLRLSGGGTAISSGRFTAGGVALVSPDISARIPNGFPGLPDLAVIDITNLSLQFASPAFGVAANGVFTTDVTVTILSGMMTITPLVGSVTNTDLSGMVSTPQPMGGTTTSNGGGVQMTAPQSSTFNFADPGTGITGSINLVGTLQGDSACQTSSNYCSANPNSSGLPAHIFSSGSTSIFANALTLEAANLPANQFGYFLFAPTQGFIPNFGGSSGNLCLGGQIVRFNKNVLFSGSAASVAFTPDMNILPQGAVWQAGDTQYFQYWTRDTGTSTTTEGLSVTFCP